MNDLFTVNIKGIPLSFKTKSGVFSKSGLDDGSRLLMENVDIKDGTLVADLGTGSGVIGMFISKLNPSGHVYLLDVNLRVIELVKENVELNKLENVEVYLSDNFSAVGDRTYHMILSNPAQHLGNEFLEELVNECKSHLKPGGELYWVVQNHVKPFIERLFNNILGNCKIVAHSKEHVLLKGVKNG